MAEGKNDDGRKQRSEQGIVENSDQTQAAIRRKVMAEEPYEDSKSENHCSITRKGTPKEGKKGIRARHDPNGGGVKNLERPLTGASKSVPKKRGTKVGRARKAMPVDKRVRLTLRGRGIRLRKGGHTPKKYSDAVKQRGRSNLKGRSRLF